MNLIPAPSRRLMSVLIAAPFVIVACGTTAAEPTSEATAIATAEPTAAPVAADETAAGDETAAAEPWLDIELTDAATGETFTLASLAGEVVAIEPMAVWCPTCRAQQDNVKSAYADIEASGATFISLGIDPGESAKALAEYAERRGYPWTFVQSPVELSRALDDRFGPQILSAPSTPLIVLTPEGQVAFQDFGTHGPDRLVEIIEEAAA